MMVDTSRSSSASASRPSSVSLSALRCPPTPLQRLHSWMLQPRRQGGSTSQVRQAGSQRRCATTP
eukprot:2838510-Rhodomonas_salina.1